MKQGSHGPVGRAPALSSAARPLRCQGVVLRDALALAIHVAKVGLGNGERRKAPPDKPQ